MFPQIGGFYEAVGLDALVLCQVCGNALTRTESGLLKAGSPVKSLGRMLQMLLAENYTVVGGECRDGVSWPRLPFALSLAAMPAWGLQECAPCGSLSSHPLVN